jgi:ATP-binding cassette subfamily B protein
MAFVSVAQPRPEGGVTPRSVIPGRQRWNVAVIKGRRDLAEILVSALLDCPNNISVEANIVTGRILVTYDETMSSDDVADLIHRAAALIAPDDGSLGAGDRSAEESPLVLTQSRSQGDRGGMGVALGGMAVAAFGALVGSPILSLLGVVGSTVVVVRRGWRNATLREGKGSRRSTRRPVRQIVGNRMGQLYRAAMFSVLAQMLFLAPGIVLIFSWIVLIRGPIAGLTGIGIATAAGQHLFLVSIVGILLIGFAVFSQLAGVAWKKLSQDVQHDWRTRLYAHVQRAELQHLDGERATHLAEVISSDVDQLGGFLSGSSGDLLQLVASFVLLVPIFFITSSSLLWVAFLPVPLIAWMSFRYQEKVNIEYGDRGDAGARLTGQLVNNMEASSTIKSLVAEDYETSHIGRLSDAFRYSNLHADTRTGIYLQTMQLLATAAFFGVLVLGGLTVIWGRLTFPVFQALVGLPFLLHGRIPGIGSAIEQYQKTVVSLQRVQELFEIPVESGDVGLDLDLTTVRGEIALDGVTFGYPGRPPVFENLSLRFPAGTTTGIVGVTGAGKTTIAKLLLRLHEVEAGRVLLDDVDVRGLKLTDLRHSIGFVSQDPFLFDGTVADNIRYGTFGADDDRVAAAARLAAADSFIERLPQKYDTMVGEKGITLSGGQRQRISLARVIVKAAPILILDEATSAVDNETEAAIQDALREFAEGRTLIVIAHRLSTVRNANRIYVLGRGGIAEEGTHDDLVERGELYAALWRRQIGEAS